MPISVTSSAAPGAGYVDVRVGVGHGIHQVLIDVSAVAASADADGYLPPGLGIAADGTVAHAAATTATCVIGPEAVKVGAVDHFGNAIFSGVLNRDAIEDNVGSAQAATLPGTIRLI